MKSNITGQTKGCLTVAILLGVCLIASCYISEHIESRPDNLFRKFVSEPIPPSVTIHQAESRLSHAVVFISFEISLNDLDDIAKQLDLHPATRPEPTQPPKWFNPDGNSIYWKGMGGTRELWYSPNSRMAYFKQVNP